MGRHLYSLYWQVTFTVSHNQYFLYDNLYILSINSLYGCSFSIVFTIFLIHSLLSMFTFAFFTTRFHYISLYLAYNLPFILLCLFLLFSIYLSKFFEPFTFSPCPFPNNWNFSLSSFSSLNHSITFTFKLTILKMNFSHRKLLF